MCYASHASVFHHHNHQELVSNSDTISILHSTRRGTPHFAQRAVLAACGVAGQVRDAFQDALATKSAALVAAMHAYEAACGEADALQEARHATVHRITHAHASTVDQLHHAVSHPGGLDVWAPLQRLQLFDEFLRWRKNGRRAGQGPANMPRSGGRAPSRASTAASLKQGSAAGQQSASLAIQQGASSSPRQETTDEATEATVATEAAEATVATVATVAGQPVGMPAAAPPSQLQQLQSELDDCMTAMELLRAAHAARVRAAQGALTASEEGRVAAEQRAAALKRSLSQLAAAHRAQRQAQEAAAQLASELMAAQRGSAARLRARLQEAQALIRSAS